MVQPPTIQPPTSRRLRVLSFDPSLATQIETSLINEITVEIPWEDLCPGPIGDCLEVVDVDPASGMFYHPVDLNCSYLLAQDGLPPSESNPQFHQQMVYAVATTTIRQFERALGRVALWADRKGKKETRDEYDQYDDQFVKRLRIYPHALRDRNAYYSPKKMALLFGYFPVTRRDAHNTPGTVVFTCLSHDIIAHEVTHALLDGVHPRFNDSTNPDVLAFHEAFADIVALFQHFSYPEVLESQIRRTRGSLDTENLLGQLAQQFGKATGRGSALRDALGTTNPETGRWELRTPDPQALDTSLSPHDRGAILVAAVFRAFILMYRSRSTDLFRIATQGTGTLPDGDIHPDLTKRLAAEAAWTADRILQTCIRAIDYVPPVDITFGDFLRGVITADLDFDPIDRQGIRIVFIESFREWGIHPRGVNSMGIDALTWPGSGELLADSAGQETYTHTVEQLRRNVKKFVESVVLKEAHTWTLESDKYNIWTEFRRVRREFREWLRQGDDFGRDYSTLFGLVTDNEVAQATVDRNRGEPIVEVQSARPALRRTRDGSVRTDLVVEMTQRRRGFFDADEQKKQDRSGEDERRDFWYRTGCTIVIDLLRGEVRRIIRTRGTITTDGELERVRRFLVGETGVSGNAFDAGLPPSLQIDLSASRHEPFALLHQFEEVRDGEASAAAERRDRSDVPAGPRRLLSVGTTTRGGR